MRAVVRRTGVAASVAILLAGFLPIARENAQAAGVLEPPRDSAIVALTRVPRAAPANLRGYGALAVRQGTNLYIVDGEAPPTRAFRRIEHGAAVRGIATASASGL